MILPSSGRNILLGESDFVAMAALHYLTKFTIKFIYKLQKLKRKC